jgi:hypothetical protein
MIQTIVLKKFKPVRARVFWLALDIHSTLRGFLNGVLHMHRMRLKV